MRIKRICIGPGEVAGYFSRLKSGFEKIGIPCEHFILTENKYSYKESDYFLRNQYLSVSHLRKQRFYLIKIIGLALETLIRITALGFAIMKCDIFIFPGSGTFLKYHELSILKFLRKRIIVVYFGSDARPPYFSGRHLDDDKKNITPKCAFSEAKQMIKNIRSVEKHADLIINHTATAQFFTRPFIRFMAIGMPIHSIPTNSKSRKNKLVNIIHAPSRPKAKGSTLIRKTISELKAEGYEIEYNELSGVSNAQVMQALPHCDFVIDELYSDMPLAMFATEAAAHGRPTIVCGFYAKQYRHDNPDINSPPSLYVNPNELKLAIKLLIDDITFRIELGRQAKNFIETTWNSENVAQNYVKILENKHPANWLCEPNNLNYYFGWGLSTKDWQNQVNAYIQELGVDALLLDHNYKLKNLILDATYNDIKLQK